MKTSRSPKAIAIYSYLVIGFVLPFAGPAASKIKGGTGKEGEESSNLSLHHCCR
ncbi:hypothetical protein K440DRAFT_618979 [Wilcoxina mikolae CBS 423.85]|nr:hypothetical protein K440DRAFT_618979 [Wilcoxina mikolae CBS 423.85]